MNTINVSELSVSNKVKLTFGLVWRGLVVGLASMVISFPLGIIAGLLADLVGLPPLVFAMPAGFGIGLVSYYYFIKWFVGTKIGNYKLLLVEAD